ncbi:hypothetical protein KM043_007453 [Ampulex compressa]|nr:hypothetical protein KM043_007453 [Ampulex compressa]
MDGWAFLLLLVLFSTANETQGLRRQKRIVGGLAAAQPPEDDPVIYAAKNDRFARVYGIRDPDKGFYVFRGIRFGEPPLGRNRFQRPVAVHLEGDINATRWAPACPQPNHADGNKIVGSEDCLFLNVFTPSLPDSSEGYPVLIWIHGGGFRRGAACQYEMRNLIKKKMIVVSIQYRLGSLGFLSSGTSELPGNNGMFDMILAVNWVRDYIQYFGGNPKRIIACGHGTGASSALMLSLSNFSRSIFSGLIAMSGSVLSHFTIDKDPQRTARFIASNNGCPTEDVPQMVACLRELPVEKLVKVDSDLENLKMGVQGFISGLSVLLGPGPVIEGTDDQRSIPNFMTQTPEDSLKLGNFPGIPLLTGVMKDETGGAIYGRYKSEVQSKLTSVPNFMNQYLVPSLQSTISDFGNKTQFASEAFSKYLNFPQSSNAANNVEKVAEATSDSLYNVPAFLTVDHWSKKAKTFLYSFDHSGKRNYGNSFLGGLPIVDAKRLSDHITSHGDDLGYVFDRNTINGEKIPDANEKLDMDDERVTEVFTDMIASFARSGEPGAFSTFGNGSWLSGIAPTFSGDTNPFISITTTPRIMTNFRYCEMGLWTGLTNRLQAPVCSLFATTLNTIGQTAKQTVDNIGKPITMLKETDFIPASKVLNNLSNVGHNGYVDQTTKEERGNARFPMLPKIPGIPFHG